LRALSAKCAYGPEYDATAADALALSTARLAFIGVFYVALLPSLSVALATTWLAVMLAFEFCLRRVLNRQVQRPTRMTRRLRILSSLASTGGWLGMGALLWLSPDVNLRVAGFGLWAAMFLYAMRSCSRFPGHFVLTGGPPLLVIILAPLAAANISLYSRITIEGAVLLFALHAITSTVMTYRQHRNLQQAAEDLAAQRAAAENASRAKSDFLAMMSHELRTPLNGVLGLAHALTATSLDPKQKSLLLGITRSGDGLMMILNDILDLTKIEAGCMEIAAVPTDIHTLAEDVHDLFAPVASAKGLRLCLAIADDVPRWVSADPLRAKQVVMNLASNAVKFTDEGEVRISLNARGPTAIFRVDDTGPGLTPAAKAKLFQRFSQGDAGVARSHGGTGLGLAVSRELAQAMGGDLSLIERDGPGASFELVVPLRPCAAPSAPGLETQVGDSPAIAHPLSLLVVEDNPINRSVVQALLEPTGWRLVFAENGAIGLETLVIAGPFDLVLMDIHMPVMDGLTALAAIRAGKAGARDIPVVALTADAMSGNREELLDAGFDGYVEKPIRPHLLLSAIQAGLTPREAPTSEQLTA
jgi:signal transduction histidine kinase/ActR/RegA family two-component response regulator